MGMRIDDEIYVHGYLDEIRQDKVIVRNEGGYFGTTVDELVEAIPKADYETRLTTDMATIKQLSNSIKALQKANSEIAVAYDKFKADYEARLKADMMAILKDIKLKIKKKSYHDTTIIGNYEDEVRVELVELDDVNDIIQEKISTLEVENGNDNITSQTKAT